MSSVVLVTTFPCFQVETKSFQEKEDAVCVEAEVKNTGDFAGKEVVQLYVSAPQGALGKPARELKAYEKTNRLLPGEACTLTFCVPKADMASYDDGGYTGYKSCYVLEAGRYDIYIGTDVRSAGLAGTFEVKETLITDQLQEAMAQICDIVMKKLGAKGVIVACTADHLCMKMRGVEKQLPATTTVETAGAFTESTTLREEFFNAIASGK